MLGRLTAGLIFTLVVGTFTLIALFSSGFVSWFLFVFLIPFWISFPGWILGPEIGWIPSVIYFIGFILVKIWLARSGKGKQLAKKWMAMGGSGGWSSSGGSFSGGGSSFSGGGGSFSGGGSSGRW